MALLSASTLILTLFSQSTLRNQNPNAGVLSWPVLANVPIAFFRYAFKLLWPHHLAVFYPHPGYALGIWKPLLATLVLMVTTFAVYRLRKRFRFLWVGWLWYIAMIAPVLSFTDYSMADRYAYLSAIGLFIAFAWGIPEMLKGRSGPRLVVVLLTAAGLIGFGVRSWFQARHWENSVTLFENALSCTEDNYVAHNNLGMALEERGDIQSAVEHYREALSIWPNHPRAHNNLGVALSKLRQFDEAVGHYRKSISLSPRAQTYYNLGLALRQMGRNQEAFENYQRALALDPNFPEVHNSIGVVTATMGDSSSAEQSFLKAVLLDPQSSEAMNNLGKLHLQRQNYQQSIHWLKRALQVRPLFPEALTNLGTALAKAGNMQEAEKSFRLALQQPARAAETYLQLAELLAALGRVEERIDILNQGLLKHPNDWTLANNLAWTLSTTRDKQLRDGLRAVLWAQRAAELSEHRIVAVSDTLAAAFAENGDFDQALEIVEQMLDQASQQQSQQMLGLLQGRKELYSQRETLCAPPEP